MKGKKAAAIALLLVGLALLVPLSSSGQSGIIVDGADSVLDTSTVYSPGLVSSTQSVTPRVAVEYAHSTVPQAPQHGASAHPTDTEQHIQVPQFLSPMSSYLP